MTREDKLIVLQTVKMLINIQLLIELTRVTTMMKEDAPVWMITANKAVIEVLENQKKLFQTEE